MNNQLRAGLLGALITVMRGNTGAGALMGSGLPNIGAITGILPGLIQGGHWEDRVTYPGKKPLLSASMAGLLEGAIISTEALKAISGAVNLGDLASLITKVI